MKKFVLSAALLAIFTGGMTAAVNVAAPESAVACSGSTKLSTELAASLPQVNRGDRGQHVLALQLGLREEGYNYLQGTGNYASETLRAVKDYQRRNGIKDSGVVGSKTWQALVGRKRATVTGGKPGSIEMFSLRPGQRSEKADWLANMLERIHPYSENVEYDGVYGENEQKLVRDFQKRAGIKASGIVGPKTLTAMDEVIAVSGRWGC